MNILEQLISLQRHNCSGQSTSTDLSDDDVHKAYKDILKTILRSVERYDNNGLQKLSQFQQLLLPIYRQQRDSNTLLEVPTNMQCILLARNTAKKILEHCGGAKQLGLQAYSVQHVLYGIFCHRIFKNASSLEVTVNDRGQLIQKNAYAGTDVAQIFASYRLENNSKCGGGGSGKQHQNAKVCVNPCHYNVHPYTSTFDSSLSNAGFPFDIFDLSDQAVNSATPQKTDWDLFLNLSNDLDQFSLSQQQSTASGFAEASNPEGGPSSSKSVQPSSPYSSHLDSSQVSSPPIPLSMPGSNYNALDVITNANAATSQSSEMDAKQESMQSTMRNPPVLQDQASSSYISPDHGKPYDPSFRQPSMIDKSKGEGNSQSSISSMQKSNHSGSGQFAKRDCWCSISYHEQDVRIGETFNAQKKNTLVQIDGFTDPTTSSNRFSVGVLGNVRRSQASVNVRKYVGRGIELRLQGSSAILTCLSENPVFVQSPNTNKMYKWAVETVVKVPKGGSLVIFDTVHFTHMLTESMSHGFDEVYSLSRMCSIRVSFVKGWGRDYRRQSIINTPCWIEIRMNKPLQWIDAVLETTGGPSGVVGSCS